MQKTGEIATFGYLRPPKLYLIDIHFIVIGRLNAVGFLRLKLFQLEHEQLGKGDVARDVEK